jgi:predicted TIM-barrel fold metal-dependent hydrolase
LLVIITYITNRLFFVKVIIIYFIFCHTGEGQAFSEPDQFHTVASQHPKGLFIVGHTGETFEGIKTCTELAKKHKNIYLDISGWGFMNKGYLEYLVKRVDVGKILFGSDFSWIDVRYAVAAVLFAEISERDKRMILSLNASRLFR